jgi:hypothetical protein
MDFSRAQGTRQMSRFPCHMNIRGRLGRRYHPEWVIMRVIVFGDGADGEGCWGNNVSYQTAFRDRIKKGEFQGSKEGSRS